MKKITLDEMTEHVRKIEERTSESLFVRGSILETAEQLVNRAENGGKFQIITDYDADGICSAYIMERFLKAVNPNIEIDVVCNDRRGAYGVPKDLQPEADTSYIVLDMGSNELDYIKRTFGEDTIVIDHHMIVSENNRDEITNSPLLLNPHCQSLDDSENAQYCATGLAYRLYEEAINIEAKKENGSAERLQEQKFKNSMGIVAAIGTATDMVDVLDEHSYNRTILKDGVRLVNEASAETIEHALGVFLTQAGTGLEDTTARNLAFNVGSYINAASRMSEVIGQNGAQLMYDTLSGKFSDGKTAQMLEYFTDLNKHRKEIVNSIQKLPEYQSFVAHHRFEESSKLAIFEVPEGTPHAFCGLVAGKLADAIDKPIICVVHNAETDTYSGSGRNRDGYSSLNEFVSEVVNSPEVQSAMKDGDVSHFGGHEDAIGLTFSSSVMEAFKEASVKYEREFIKPDLSDKLVLDVDFADLLKQEQTDKVLALEPLGTGLQLPPVEIEGKQTYARSVAKRDDWQSFGISGLKGSKISNWAYDSAQNLPDKNDQIKFLAEINVSNYGGNLHLEFSQMWNEEHYADRMRELVESAWKSEQPAPSME